MTTETTQSFHKNGKLRSEATFVDGIPHGATRFWHDNGQLAREIPVNRGVLDGVGRQWDRTGKLLGTSEMRNGTGISREWHENGTLYMEIPYVDGFQHGVARMWYQTGLPQGDDTYFFEGRVVSKAKFDKLSKERDAMKRGELPPRLTGEALRSIRAARAKGPEILNRKLTGEKFARELSLNGVEALSWLYEGEPETRTLGEDWTPEDSIEFVERAYALGALSVIAFDIDVYDEGFQNTGNLAIVLPQPGPDRAALFDLERELAEERGFEGTRDSGGKWLRLYLK